MVHAGANGVMVRVYFLSTLWDPVPVEHIFFAPGYLRIVNDHVHSFTATVYCLCFPPGKFNMPQIISNWFFECGNDHCIQIASTLITFQSNRAPLAPSVP